MKRWITTGVALLGLTFGETKAADPPKVIPEAEQGEGVSLTVYNQNFVIVKERRKLELVKGRGVIKFKDVASTILPDTVQFGTLRDPGIARVVEQNYEFDLVGANKLLEKYIDRDIAIVTQDGETIKGKLLSFDDSQLMLKTDKGIDLLPRVGNVKDVQFSALPGGLLTRPTLVWKLDSKNTGAELVKVAYRANEMSWRVDYRARLNQAGDRLSLAGWVTVTNNTGTSYRNAQVKLMAGDVNTINTNPIVPTSGPPPNPNSGGSGGGPAFVEKTFSDYHLYEMQRKTDLLDRETKQIELMDIDGVTFDKKYVTGTQYGNKVAVVVEFENDEKKTPGLGIPLPKGPIRLFQVDKDGELEFIGQDSIDHTPRHEKLRLSVGNAFDIVAERKLVQLTQMGDVSEQEWEIRLRNHTNKLVKIEVIEKIHGRTGWKLLKQSHQFVPHDVDTLIFPAEVKADSETIVNYRVRYSPIAVP